MSANHYGLLRVAQSASQVEIKDAYRRLALKLHPDRNGGCTDKTRDFKLASEAYRVLSDELLRRNYDNEIGILRKSVQSAARKSKIYAPARPKEWNKTYDFDEWNKQHYGDTFNRTLRRCASKKIRINEDAYSRSIANSAARRYTSEKEDIVGRMQRRRDSRPPRPKPNESACLIQ
eukprot:CAMPEP_0185775682 /NCGR_PEP_ID=MMETSP1174-20130828/82924_1 /TAXON_ID=35687 /ORGANISM="Dictyocha speculum, Strain CCMP1381" /LENGTH=175 /DNA_ID=CAMNT_0028463345 /DNA_START=56 /DNA_END=583 /DNA_ORIENTATION=+